MSRRPPSLRNAEYAQQRQGRQLQSMSPGTAGGRLASASPVPPADGSSGSLGEAVATDGAPFGVAFVRDRFPSSGTLSGAATTLTLTETPLDGSLHLYLNGLELDEGTDYTLSGDTVTVLTAAGTGAGDVLDARYAYDDAGTTTSGTQPVVIGLADTFTRADSGSLGTAESGQSWVSISGTPSIVSNKAKFPAGNGMAIADSSTTDGAFTVAITTGASLTIDAALIFRSDSTATNYLFAQLFNDGGGTSGVRLAKTGGPSTGIVNYTSLAPATSTVYTIQVLLSGSSVTVNVNGTTVISYTLTSGEASLFTGSYVGLRIASSDTRSVFDDIQVTA